MIICEKEVKGQNKGSSNTSEKTARMEQDLAQKGNIVQGSKCGNSKEDP